MIARRSALPRAFLIGATVSMAIVWPTAVRAQARCESAPTNTRQAAVSWTPPLERAISLHVRETSLKDALERLAAAARIRLSYSADLLPLDRRICLAYDSVAIGNALGELVQGTNVTAVVAGANHVVLAPRADRSITPTLPREPEQVFSLDPVVVEVNAVAAAQKPHAFDAEVLDGRQLVEQNATTLAQAFNGAVPGMWVWGRSPSSFTAQYGSIRGASSFGLSHPKVYINGIEVANPLLITRLSPESIERIEIVRGPEGAALYGANGISGVTNIITRHETVDGGAPRARLRSGFGLASSDFAHGPALEHEHSLSLLAGSMTKSAGLNVTAGSIGELIPGGYARHLSADGTLRWIRSRSLFTGTLRFFTEEAGTPISPLLGSTGTQPPMILSSTATAADPQSVIQYTAGINATFTPGELWTHSVVLGVDGYALNGVRDDRSPFPSPEDSALLAAGAGGMRGTLRLSSAARFRMGDRATGAVTLAAEHSMLRQRSTIEAFDPYVGWSSAGAAGPHSPQHATSGSAASQGAYPPPEVGPESIGSQLNARQEVTLSRGNTALSAQMDAALFDRLFLTGGLRVEREDRPFSLARYASLPMLGGALVSELGPLDVKLRAAYGKGIRWPQGDLSSRVSLLRRPRTSPLGLEPEEQAGVEAGIDINLRKTLAVQVTRFDQTASGLIQRIAVSAGSPTPDWSAYYVTAYELQNVGEISNRGWELQASAKQGHFSIAGTLSLVDSRVQQVAEGYTGDLQPGDRMLAVPARTMSLTAVWSVPRWSTSVTAYRATDWINYDRLALARASVDPDQMTSELLGEQLRAYWRQYDGITHLQASIAHEIRPELTLVLSGVNLLDRQVGEPDNATILPGRTVSVGMRFAF
jgi:iron complex outermembrane receptor protein